MRDPILEKRDGLAVIAPEPDDMEVFKAVAGDIAKEVAHHIRTMYPAAVKAASSTFLLSVRGCVYNEIMAALNGGGKNQTLARLERRTKFRRHISAIYSRLRREGAEGVW